jgi:hypothetical protein
MTGFESKRQAAQDKLQDDADTLTIVYQRGFADGKRAAQRKPLTEREIELIDGMIEVQRDHAKRCDNIENRTMADKQKGWDMERVELLLKLKAAHNIKEGT